MTRAQVDQHVGNKLFNLCIRGLLAPKTVILVTNQLQYLPRCDRIVVVRGGKIEGAPIHTVLNAINLEFPNLEIAVGTYKELRARNVDFGIPQEEDKKVRDAKPYDHKKVTSPGA